MRLPIGGYGSEQQLLQAIYPMPCEQSDAEAQTEPSVVSETLKLLPQELLSSCKGTGAVIPFGLSGTQLLYIGYGIAVDCYICAALVGESGFVLGVELDENSLVLAKEGVADWTKKLGFKAPNINFLSGQLPGLERISIPEESANVMVCNVVLSSTPDQREVLKNLHKYIPPGGELFITDVFCNKRLPSDVKSHPDLSNTSFENVLYDVDFRKMAMAAGFAQPRHFSRQALVVNDPKLKALLGTAKFVVSTYRLFKFADLLEPSCEDYGQVAVYKGSISGSNSAYQLDGQHCFEAGKPVFVCGNTAAMLGEGWLRSHFAVFGDRSVHYGRFSCPQKTSLDYDGNFVYSSRPCCC